MLKLLKQLKLSLSATEFTTKSQRSNFKEAMKQCHKLWSLRQNKHN